MMKRMMVTRGFKGYQEGSLHALYFTPNMAVRCSGAA